MKKHITFAHPLTLEEAIAHGTEFEAVEGNKSRKPETCDRVAMVTEPASSEALTLETVSKLIDERLEQFAKTLQKPRKPKCYICQDSGHMRDKCPYLAKLDLPKASKPNKEN